MPTPEPRLDFAEFFRAEYPALVRSLYLLTANRAEAEELAQEAMARTYERWDRVSKMKSPGGYVYRITLNLNRNRLRHLALRVRRLLSLAPEQQSPSGGEIQTELVAAIASLPTTLREAFILVEWLGLTTEEAAEILRIKAVSVRSRLHRARAALREALRENIDRHG